MTRVQTSLNWGKAPPVSIIVTSYNNEKYIREALESVGSQDYPNVECVVVEDCSSDDSVKIIQEFIEAYEGPHSFRLIEHERNSGQLAAVYTGLDATTGIFVTSLDADDTLFPHYVARHIEAHLSSPSPASLSCSNEIVIDANGALLSGSNMNTFQLDRLDCCIPFPHQCRVNEDSIAKNSHQSDDSEISDGREVSDCGYLIRPDGYTFPSWYWTTMSAMCFRRSALELIRPLENNEIRLCADYYMAIFSHSIGGSIVFKERCGRYRIHGENGWATAGVIGASLSLGADSTHINRDYFRHCAWNKLHENKDHLSDIIGSERYKKLCSVFVFRPQFNDIRKGVFQYIKEERSLCKKAGISFLKSFFIKSWRHAYRLFERFVYVLSKKWGSEVQHLVGSIILNKTGIFDSEYFVEQAGFNRSASTYTLLEYYLTNENRFGRKPNKYFDPDFYTSTYPFVKNSQYPPLLHYYFAGAQMGLLPSIEYAQERSISKDLIASQNGITPLNDCTPSRIASFSNTMDQMKLISDIVLKRPPKGKPDFIIAGAMKSATTSLQGWLRKHPDVRIVYNKEYRHGEFHFFNIDEYWEKGIDWYLRAFPEKGIRGEKSPGYISNKVARCRIARTLPDIKIIVLLREPVARLRSTYRHYMRAFPRSREWGWPFPGDTFERNIEAELESYHEHGDIGEGSLLGRSIYVKQLKHFFELLPREQFLIGTFEEFTQNPQPFLNKVCDFIGAKRINESTFPKNNVAPNPIKPMTDEFSQQLYDFYKPYNEELFELLGYKIKEWER